LFRGKEATRADVLQAQLEVESTQVLSTNAHNRLTSSWRALSSVVGDPHLSHQKLNGDAYEPPHEIDFEQALLRLQSESPEISSAMAEIGRARSALERAQVERVSNVSVQGLVNVIDNGIGGRPDGAIGISMPIPVFNRNQGGVLKAQHEVVAAEQSLQQIELGLQNRLAPTYERYSNARNQVERYRDAILPAAQESLDLTRKMYRAGETGFLTLLTSQRTYSQTNINFLEALRELRTAEAEIEGLLLRDSLNSGTSR
ncbi:MAG: TolC family protein, partial [Planctomycetota bacterium]